MPGGARGSVGGSHSRKFIGSALLASCQRIIIRCFSHSPGEERFCKKPQCNRWMRAPRRFSSRFATVIDGRHCAGRCRAVCRAAV